METKTCCVTGHRDIPADKAAYVKARLQEEIEQAIADGFTTFITGMAKGTDLLFAGLVLAQKVQHPHLFLVAAIPYQNRLNSADPLFSKMLRALRERACAADEIQRRLLYASQSLYGVAVQPSNRRLRWSRKGRYVVYDALRPRAGARGAGDTDINFASIVCQHAWRSTLDCQKVFCKKYCTNYKVWIKLFQRSAASKESSFRRLPLCTRYRLHVALLPFAK